MVLHSAPIKYDIWQLVNLRSATMDAKTKHLMAAAYSYALIAPATSAHLSSHCYSAATNRALPSLVGEFGACKGCGTIFIPGSNSRISIVHGTEPKNRTRSSNYPHDPYSTRATKFIKVDCLTCHRYEKTPLQGSISTRPKKHSLSDNQTPPSVSVVCDNKSSDLPQSSKTGTVNASSKQRAKARKKGSLQAILEKSKVSTTASAGFGLDLLDLMKQT